MHPLDNPFWNALEGPQRHLAVGGTLARRYASGLAPQCAVASSTPAARRALVDLLEEGETVDLFWSGPRPMWSGLTEVLEAELLQLVVTQLTEVMPPSFVELGEADVPEMLDLASTTHPGPLLSQAIRLGRFIGVRDNGSLVAMAGERAHLTGYREISGVCTLPSHRGRGYARGLVHELANSRMKQGERPFLHVATQNHAAIRVYEGIGFAPRARMTVNVLRKD